MSAARASKSVRAPRALAIAAHPDDIEFVMAGTLLLLREAGWELHCLNLSTGNLGSLTISPARIAQARRREAQAAAAVLGAHWHPPICADLEIFYDGRTLKRLGAVIREVAPSVILTHSPQDYMEDHMNTARLAVTAAFARAIPGYRTMPARKPYDAPVTIYHASPHGLRDQLRRLIVPGAFVDTTSVQEQKRTALACHTTQRDFLDRTQGMGSFREDDGRVQRGDRPPVEHVRACRGLAPPPASRVLRRGRRSAPLGARFEVSGQSGVRANARLISRLAARGSQNPSDEPRANERRANGQRVKCHAHSAQSHPTGGTTRRSTAS
jgi:LmbE family N-acetylglucosaminyl deacetylase